MLGGTDGRTELAPDEIAIWERTDLPGSSRCLGDRVNAEQGLLQRNPGLLCSGTTRDCHAASSGAPQALSGAYGPLATCRYCHLQCMWALSPAQRTIDGPVMMTRPIAIEMRGCRAKDQPDNRCSPAPSPSPSPSTVDNRPIHPLASHQADVMREAWQLACFDQA